MLRKTVLALMIAMLVLIPALATGCDSSDSKPGLKQTNTVPITGGGTLTLSSSDPQTLDPALIYDSLSASYVMEIFSGLFTLDRDLKLVPDIVEEWDIGQDGKTYTFHLREDAHFHSGKQVTADDFKYSMERAADPTLGSRTVVNYLGDIVGVAEKLAGEAARVSGIKVLDTFTLQVTIDAPKSYFLAKLVHPVAFVVNSDNVENDQEWWRHPDGTGPFKLKQWDNDDRLVLERNDSYYGEIPKLEQVVFNQFAGIPMILYENEEIDITGVSLLDIERVLDPLNSLNRELVTIPEFSLWYIGFNATKPPFDDAKVRQAFAHAIDKDRIISQLLKDTVVKADGILPPGMPGYNDDLIGLAFDPQAARDLLADSAYPDLTSVTMTTAGRGDVSPINEVIIDMWRQHLGVDVSIRQMDPEVYFQWVKEEKDEIFDLGWVADYPDPQNFLDMMFYTRSEDNVGEYSNSEIDALLEEAREEMDTTVRMNMYQEIEQLLIDEAACLPLFFTVSNILVKPYVMDFVASPMPIPWLKYVWLEAQE